MAMNMFAFLAARNATEGLPSDRRNLFSILAAQAGTGLQGAVPAIALGKSEVATTKTNETVAKLSVAEADLERQKIEAAAELTAVKGDLESQLALAAKMTKTVQELWHGMGKVLLEAAKDGSGNVKPDKLKNFRESVKVTVGEQVEQLQLLPVKLDDNLVLDGALDANILSDPAVLGKLTVTDFTNLLTSALVTTATPASVTTPASAAAPNKVAKPKGAAKSSTKSGGS